jgi:hypothetical protein
MTSVCEREEMDNIGREVREEERKRKRKRERENRGVSRGCLFVISSSSSYYILLHTTLSSLLFSSSHLPAFLYAPCLSVYPPFHP